MHVLADGFKDDLAFMLFIKTRHDLNIKVHGKLK